MTAMSTHVRPDPNDPSRPKRGLTESDLATRETVFRPDLLAGQRLLITGGGSGMGKAMAVLAARLGAEVAICGRDPGKLEKTAALVRERTGRAVLAEALTIRDPDAVDAFMARVFVRFGGLDTLVNNAGGQFPQDAIDFSRKGWLAVIDTNLNGTWWMMQEAARAGATPARRATSSTSSPMWSAGCRRRRIPARRGLESSISPRRWRPNGRRTGSG
jgi:NAD(P)-dependent dehydrogenase (short-subunit alcohol dehydrogenase family)